MSKFQKYGGGLNPPPYVISRVTGREKFLRGVFTYFGYARSKKAHHFFETKNIFIFGAGPNFGRGQKRGVTL